MYKTILADPPWPEYGGGQIKRGADAHYSLMSVKEITQYMIEKSQLAEPNAHMYLWVTNNYLVHGLEVMKASNFNYKTTITWVKDRIGLGQYFRGITEHCLFGVRGMVPYAVDDEGHRMQGKTVIDAPKSTHSTKPIELYEMIEKVSQPPYLELFARTKRIGWNT